MSRQREKFQPDELAEVLKHYEIGKFTEVTEFARGSHAAPKLILTTDRGKFLLKRRPQSDMDPFRVAFSHSLQRYLVSKNFPLPHLIGTRDENNSMLKLDRRIYEMYEFIDGEHYNQSWIATYEAGKTLALYHSLVEHFHSEFEPPKGHFHDSKMVYDSFRQMGELMIQRPALAGRGRELIALLKDLKRAYNRAARAANRLGVSNWKPQIVHSDWHPGNLLFQGDHVVAVIDHDSARIRPRAMDVANGCLQFSMVTGGRDLSTWEARTDIVRAKRFLRGYDETNVLSKAELSTLPHLMQEVLIAQAVPPILRTGTFAGLEGFEFLKVVLAKMEWLRENDSFIDLDSEDA
ncbi:MAG: phosphotransferase [Phycisphaerae bacterium]|nr:phosphotransferase [Phycisphaerae bacterium]